MITAGIDSGSRTVKTALMSNRDLLGWRLRDQGIHQRTIADVLLAELATEHAVPVIDRRVATGYARGVVVADRAVTEITCHAAGVHHLRPDAGSVIEIGGQDSKVIRLGGDGGVADFQMNDRCAAGTGRFLEMVAIQLETAMDDFDQLIATATSPAVISSMCVVFAESEIVGLLAGGTAPADILLGIEHAIAERIAAMAGRLLVDPVVFTGGVALVPGMARALANRLGREVHVCPHAPATGAIGAAILAGR